MVKKISKPLEQIKSLQKKKKVVGFGGQLLGVGRRSTGKLSNVLFLDLVVVTGVCSFCEKFRDVHL